MGKKGPRCYLPAKPPSGSCTSDALPSTFDAAKNITGIRQCGLHLSSRTRSTVANSHSPNTVKKQLLPAANSMLSRLCCLLLLTVSLLTLLRTVANSALSLFVST